MPPFIMLQHIVLIGDEAPPSATPPTEIHNAVPVNTQELGLLMPRAHCAALLGAGLPPILAKLVSRIEDDEFIDMVELLPERLDPSRTLFTDKPEPPKFNRCYETVTSILKWTQCFAIYAVILCKKCPEKLPNMLSYLILTIQNHVEYEGNAWLGYNRRFRQRVVFTPQVSWAKSDSTCGIWPSQEKQGPTAATTVLVYPTCH